MLKTVLISNIVLIENAAMEFSQGFNVLSGESGAGKSAIMHALALIAGGRCDASVIRHGAEKGVVEASFDMELPPSLTGLLEQAGIEHEAGSELLIKREISIKGKGRAFINNQSVQPTLLQKVTRSLFEIVGQHANQKLLELDYHRYVLDLYAELEENKNAFAACWHEQLKAQRSLDELLRSETEREKEIAFCRRTIEELIEADIKIEEEEQLFSEYSRLSNAEALLTKASEIHRTLSGEKSSVLLQLNRQKATFEQLIQLAPDLSETAAAFDSALLELNEVSHVLQGFQNQIEFNPSKAAALNKRLELINLLKRKYAVATDEIPAFLEKTQQRLHLLENAETHIEELKEKLEALSRKSSELCRILTNHRKAAALKLQTAMNEQLHSLNMSNAEFFVELSPKERSIHGDDKIEFFFRPNVGEHKVAVKECASGGELSRIMLAIQTLLAGKELIPCLIFDEIDSNIGGETAVIIGKKLLQIGKNHQVLCITHFHQVAVQATHHFRVQKKEIAGRTVSLIDLLNLSNRHEELSRMQGGLAP